jgi:hypothetical protein
MKDIIIKFKIEPVFPELTEVKLFLSPEEGNTWILHGEFVSLFSKFKDKEKDFCK